MGAPKPLGRANGDGGDGASVPGQFGTPLQAGGRSQRNPILPSLSLPKGGGAIRGIGEKFSTNPVAGTGLFSVPISTSPGRVGFGPSLQLSYDSGGGNGSFGLGWSLSLPQIVRKTDKGLPCYDDGGKEDVFLLSGTEDLVPALCEDGARFSDTVTVAETRYRIQRYRPRIESLFARIERWTSLTDPAESFWRSISRDNVTTWYGKTGESRIADPAEPSRIFAWLICEGYNDKGNAIAYSYLSESSDGIAANSAHERNRTPAGRSANRYLKRICYGNRTPHVPALAADQAFTPLPEDWLFEVVFDYGDHPAEAPLPSPAREWPARPDPFSTYRAGFEVRTYRLCQRALVFHHFPNEPGVGKDCLVSSTDFTYADEIDPARATNPIYSRLVSVTQRGYKRQTDGGYVEQALPPLELDYSEAVIDDVVHEVEEASLENLPIGLDGAAYQWTDLHGEGVPGILTEQGGAWFYKRNLGPISARAMFAPVECVALKPNLSLARGRAQFMDLASDGMPDVVVLDAPGPGLYEHDGAEGWQQFRAFPSSLTRDLGDPDVRFIDLDGDGRADVLITEDDALVWHQSLAESGFAPARRVSQGLDEEKGPRIVFANHAHSIFLADMSGDGLTDLVRIRNGEVCYWPNLGYGRFGTKVAMDNAPWFDAPDQFEPKRVLLADIDGTGTTDILYLHRDGVRAYFNLSGNGWSISHTLRASPRVDDLAAVNAIDLLGHGTACLVWSSPLPGDQRRQMRYVDLMGGQKPHLLVRIVSNMGAETRVRYASSTRFYVADKLAGTPWVTRLPFPVHVVEQVETFDHIAGTRFVTRYAYHHGYFDGEEREFRGFGMVEQHDTEAFEDYVVGVRRVEGDQELAPELYQPPITTRTWYHTGAFLERDVMLHQLHDGYYLKTQHLPEPVLPNGLDAAELRECVRALKGLPLRQETYSFDHSPFEGLPYCVVENSFEVRCLQRRGGERYAVFFPVGRESLALNYDRDPADPRRAHTLALDVNEYGQVRRACQVVYGRKVADPSLPAVVTADQQRPYVTYAESDFTADIDQRSPTTAYRLRVAYEQRSYEVTGVAPAAELFGRTEIAAKIAAATDIPYEVIASGVAPQKRLLFQDRTVFLDDALNPLPLGQWAALGLVHQTFQLAFTPGVIGAHYAGRVTDAELTAAGYVAFGGDAGWWVPSDTPIFPANPADHFYLPIGARDPLGVESVVALDEYDLLPECLEVRQAAWSVITAVNDYRVLGPVELTDPNQNRSGVELDALGRVVKTAVMGKAGAGEGDTLADPTMRMEYELLNWKQHRKPNFVHGLARERHGAANTRWQESYMYFNGRGGVAMAKVQAHPGRALQVEADGTVTEVDANPRWVGNGRVVLNNKGSPVKQYEPYFSTTHEYEGHQTLGSLGVTPIVYYDPLGRNVRTLYPNGTLARIEFNSWRVRMFDVNDTVRESQWYADRGTPDPEVEPEPIGNTERRAAWLAAKHANTPGVIDFDSLGRRCYATSDFGGGKSAAVRTELDLTGRLMKLFDQSQREVASSFTGMAGTPVLNSSAEKGRRWTFVNVLGAVVKTWDEHGRLFRVEYDVLHRALGSYVQQAGQAEILFSYVVYGDRHPDAVRRNLLGVAHQIFDQAGMILTPELDFKNTPKHVERVLAKSYNRALDWKTLAATPDYAAIQAAADQALETGEIFTASSEYDALSRPRRVTLPDGTVVEPTYNEANFFASLKAQIRGQGNFIDVLKSQEYDAKGQRQVAQHGNDVFLRYVYDPKTFRLTNVIAHRRGEDPGTQALQDLRYTYDPAGNVVQLDDEAQRIRYFQNAVVKPESRFEYDAIYQLIRATGREHASTRNDSIRTEADLDFVPQLPHANDAAAVRTYSEEYDYDLLGNIKQLRHRYVAGGAMSGWTRRYRYAYEDDASDATNRLMSSSLSGDPEDGPFSATYAYDAYGNMTRMPHLAAMDWSFMDQLRRVDLGGGGTAWYIYGNGGQRLRKVVERPGNLNLEWIYLGAVTIFRRRRRDTRALRLERWTVHLSDDTGRVAQVDTKTRDDDNADPANPLDVPLFRYLYSNHIGSALLETNEDGAVISYEEYHPYGTTAYRSAKPGFDLSLKRFRFSGKERDDETALYYFGERYYAPWLGRWTSSDPAGFADGTNLYRYAQNNPVTLHDPNGRQTVDPRSVRVVQRRQFTGSETLAQLRALSIPSGYRFDPAITEANLRNYWVPGGGSGGAGGTWAVLIPDSGDSSAQSGAESQSQTDAGGNDRGGRAAPSQGSEGGGANGDGGDATTLPARPLVQPGPVPQSPLPTEPIPKLDITQAPPGTDFAREEAAARRTYRAQHGLTGRDVAVQHPQKWREGTRTNTHPRITNDPDFLHPISNRRGTGGTVGGRTYATEHTYADRGLYPREAGDTQRRYGSFATERVTTLWAGQRVRNAITGSRGPLFLREYIIGPMLRGAAGHFALAATRTFVPFVAEAELGLLGGGMLLYNAGYTSAGVAVFGAASYVPVVGGGLVAGAVVGNAAESVARELGASESVATGVGAGSAALAGAGVGALIGSVIPGVGTAIGAAVGAVAGLIGYGLSKLF